MTKSKSTKRALLSSVLALVLTCTMLLGTTFAWFTDSVKSGANKIVAGNLDVELEYATVGEDGVLQDNWATVEGKTDLFKTDTLWEPGHAEVVYLRVRNAGTLALKYKFAMNIASETTAKNVANEDFKLSQYLKYGVVENQSTAFADRAAAITAVASPTALSGYSKEGNLSPAAEEYAAIVVYMPETVGNEANYRGDVIPTIDLGVTLVATQDTVEEDSWDDQYDANAVYPVVSTDELNAVTANIPTDKPTIITLSDDVAGINGVRTKAGADLTMDFNGNTATVATSLGSSGTETNGMQLLKGSTVVLKNGTFAPTLPNTSVKILINNYTDNLTLDNFTLDASASSLVGYVLSNNHGDVLVTNGSNIIAADGKFAFDAYYWPSNSYTDGVRVVIDETAGLIKGKIEFTNDGTAAGIAGQDDPALHSITIKGGYFTENPELYVATGYKVIASTQTFVINGNSYQANYQVVPQ